MAIPSVTLHAGPSSRQQLPTTFQNQKQRADYIAAKAAQFAAGHQRQDSAPQTTVTRKDFTDRLGLPADASNEQVFAAIDAAKKPKAVPAAPNAAQRQQVAEDALYASFMGKGTVAMPIAARDEDEVYARVYGA